MKKINQSNSLKITGIIILLLSVFVVYGQNNPDKYEGSFIKASLVKQQKESYYKL